MCYGGAALSVVCIIVMIGHDSGLPFFLPHSASVRTTSGLLMWLWWRRWQLNVLLSSPILIVMIAAILAFHPPASGGARTTSGQLMRLRWQRRQQLNMLLICIIVMIGHDSGLSSSRIRRRCGQHPAC